MRTLEFKTGHVIFTLAYTYKFQLKTTMVTHPSLKVSKTNNQTNKQTIKQTSAYAYSSIEGTLTQAGVGRKCAFSS